MITFFRSSNNNFSRWIILFGESNFGSCLFFKILQFSASFAKNEAIIFFRDINRQRGLRLESLQHFTLGLQNSILFTCSNLSKIILYIC